MAMNAKLNLTPDPTSYTAWLRVISAENGTKPIDEDDARNLGALADGITAQAAEMEQLRALLKEWVHIDTERDDIAALRAKTRKAIA